MSRRLSAHSAALPTAIILVFLACAALAADIRGATGPASGPSSSPAATKPPATASQATTRSALPITTANTPQGKLLKQWWAEGTAAGNAGDWYDNRDRGHSDLGTAVWPQLQRYVYTPDELARRADWAAQRVIRPHVTFGNSSTSAGVSNGGSNVRMYYDNPRGLAFLYEQYIHNNVYIYPEHVDHDPGHNGAAPLKGYGDLYPTNTPYLFTSQGSSGTDQPFMRAIPNTLAAFRPEVKKKLAQAGILMPTIQMLLRFTAKNVATPDDYLTGKAHPTVFEGANVDDLTMMNMAHEMAADNVPPMIQLKVVSEDEPVNGKDYFEPGRTEKLADTPCVIARIWRAMQYTRKMTVSAAPSVDLNKRPLTFRWVVLRGDPATITIKPDKAGSTAEIALSYPFRRPVAEGSPLESNRVDIGVFANNGAYWSAPGFITFYGLDYEARTYDAAGRPVEIGYGNGDTTLQVNWQSLFDQLKNDPDHQALKLLREGWKDSDVAALASAGQDYSKLTAASKAAQEKAAALSKAYQKANANVQELTKTLASKPSDQVKADLAKAKETQKQAQTDSEAANKASAAAAKAAEDFIGAKREDLGRSIQELVMARLTELVEDPAFLKDHAETMAKAEAGARARNVLASAKKRLAGYGIIAGESDFQLRPVLNGKADNGKTGGGEEGKKGGPKANPSSRPLVLSSSRPAVATSTGGAGISWKDLTVYERTQLKRANAEVLSYLLPQGVLSAPFNVYYVDRMLAMPKAWRDVFEYDASGKIVRWTRYDGQKAQEIDPANPPPVVSPATPIR
ncbi:MAG: hypothetical protein ACE15C_10105 [Phycisphaerae bacterium]